ncbi:DUF3560 domain-containing protein [Kitasatospora sp. NPDC093550]|uniref:DUF3560 domain-containing protein n=1 Tax=Kitasatospora sp. NPDC093550 TaxID=3364089 RepID=UPI0037FC538E
MTIQITHTRREGTLVDGTSRGDGSAEILKLREYGRTLRQPFRWSRNLDTWYLPHSRDHAAYTPNLELLVQRLRDAGFDVTLTVDNADRRSFTEAEQDREDRAEARADRFGGYADNAARNSQAARKSAHAISERFEFGQPILVGHHSEPRARRDRDRMDSAMRTSISEGDRAQHWADRQKAAASYEQFRTDPGRTLRRLEKLRADLRAVEKWQRGESAKGYSRNPADPELTIRHEELTEEIAHWEQVIKDAEAQGVKVWSKADFKRGDFVRYRGTWYEVLRVNPKSVTIPHIFNGTGRTVVRAADDGYDGWTSTAPYDDVSGRKSAAEMQPAAAPAPVAEPQVQAQPSPPIGEPVHTSAPAAEADQQEDTALVLIVSKNSPRRRKRALWAMTRREAQAVCSDPRTSGRSYMLTWTQQPGTEGADWEWVPDNGSLDQVLEDLDITPRREWTAARQAPAAAA